MNDFFCLHSCGMGVSTLDILHCKHCILLAITVMSLLSLSLSSDQPAYLAEPFACGQAFISSVFDSLTTVTFHSPGIIYLLESLLGTLPQRSKCGIMIELPISAAYHFVGNFYGKLYHYMADQGLLCIGIHRQLYPGSCHRYIITAPNSDLILLHNDILLALKLTE